MFEEEPPSPAPPPAWRWAASAGRVLVQEGLDWLYPRRCLACDAETAGPTGICASCWAETEFIGSNACRRCGAPSALSIPSASRTAPDPCEQCRGRPVSWRRAAAATVYGGAARRLVLGLKHGDRLDAAPAMGAWMARAGAPLFADGDAPILVPTPLHWRRRMARRGDQAAALAAATARRAGLPVALDALRRPKPTPSLEGLSAAERMSALADAVRPARRWRRRLAGRRVIVIDDVLTSGATLNACVAALREIGAGPVDVLVFARTLRPLEPQPLTP